MKKQHFTNLMNEIEEYAEQRADYTTKSEKLTANRDYSESYKQEQQSKLFNTFTDYQAKSRESVQQTLSTIKNELPSDSINLKNTELSSAISIIEATNGKIASNERRSIVEQFRGDLPSLKVLKAAFEKHGVKDELFDELIFDPVQRLGAIDDMIYRAYAPNGSIVVLAEEIATLANLYNIDVVVPDIKEDAGGRLQTKFGIV